MDHRHLARRAGGAWRAFADRWLPRGCALCDTTLGGAEFGLCEPCFGGLPGRLATRCLRCGLALSAPAAPSMCAACEAAQPAHERIIVLADYAAPLDRLIHALKFKGELSLAASLGARMAPVFADAGWQADAFVPVPLAAGRIATRGFNQSAAIAHGIRRFLDMPVRTGLLARSRETAAQSTLALTERHDNLVGAFRASPAAAGLRLVLIDDVMTTGSTLDAAACALRAAGARTVAALVAARTP